jgi:Holliday junction resolvase RusA-like endonuclease
VSSRALELGLGVQVFQGVPAVSWTGRLQPIALARSRVVFAGRRVRSYTPDTSEQFRDDLRMLWRTYRPRIRPITEGRLGVALRFTGRGNRSRRGDLDNYVKAVLDAGNGFLWADDRQVEALLAMFGPWGPKLQPEVAVEVWRLG